MKNRYGFGENAPGNNSVSNLHNLNLKGIVKKNKLRVLTKDQFFSWQKNGFVIVENAINHKEVEETKSFIWDFQEMDENDSQTWYKQQLIENQMEEINNSGMVECYNNQVLWNNRQNPKVYNSFVDIWDREDLWVTIDRANLNTPNRNGREFDGFIHWDANTSLIPLPVNVQGVLALTSTNIRTGGFQCVPSLFRDLETWIDNQPKDRDPYIPDLSGYETEFISMKEGDLLIWNSLLPHGILPNNSETYRMAQYISMVPAEEENEEIRSWRVKSWSERSPPEGYAFPGDPRNWENYRYPRAVLSQLGRKLLGVESWKNI